MVQLHCKLPLIMICWIFLSQGESIERSVSFVHKGKNIVLDLVPNRLDIMFLYYFFRL